MAVTFLGYVPFYNDTGELMCTVPCFNMGANFPFSTSGEILWLPKSVVESMFASANFIATNEKLKPILDGKSPIFTNKNNGWAISADYRDDLWIGAKFATYSDGVYSNDLTFRYVGNGYSPSERVDIYPPDYTAFFMYNDIDVPVCTAIVVFYETDDDNEYGRVYGYIKPDAPLGPKFNTDLINYAYIYDPDAPRPPDNPENIEAMIIRPARSYAAKGEEIQFYAEYRYNDGTYIEAMDVTWSVYEEYASVNSDGLVTIKSELPVENPGVVVTATGSLFEQYPQLKQTALIYVDSSAIYDPNIPSGSVQNPQNQYFPGGISGGSGVPQGSYDNSFGPNVSTLIPGVRPNGEGITGGTGAVGSDIANSGMYTKYICGRDMLNTLAQFFWEDNVGIQALKLVFGNPIDSVISLTSYPFDISPLVENTRQHIFFGKYDSLLDGFALSKSSTQIDWGTIEIKFYWGNFLDYAPYTQVQLYLPWGTGFVTIDPNEIMPYSENPADYNSANYKPGSIRVITNIEFDKGACVHHVIGNRGLVIGSYGGVVGKQIPMTALDQSAKMLALLGAASGVGMAAANAMAGAATGKYTNTIPMPFQSFSRGQYGPNMRQGMGHLDVFDSGAMAGDMGSSRAMKAGLASAAALASTPPNYPRAGTFSDATGSMVVQQPYIIISRPAQSVPKNHGHYNGYPSNIYYDKLSMVSGYTEISEIHLDNIPASIVELNELDSILKGGVLL